MSVCVAGRLAIRENAAATNEVATQKQLQEEENVKMDTRRGEEAGKGRWQKQERRQKGAKEEKRRRERA